MVIARLSVHAEDDRAGLVWCTGLESMFKKFKVWGGSLCFKNRLYVFVNPFIIFSLFSLTLFL